VASLAAHIAGLPVEEAIAQLAPAGVAILVALRALYAARPRRPHDNAR
jgi:hypothetical protein